MNKNKLQSVSGNLTVVLVLSLTIVWFVLLLVFTGVASSLLRKPYGDDTTTIIGRLLVTVCLLAFIWRLGWMDQVLFIGETGRFGCWL